MISIPPAVEIEVIGGDVPSDELLEQLAEILLGLVDAEESQLSAAQAEGPTE